MLIAHLARAENELLASLLEDKLRLVFREHLPGAVVLLRQFFLPLHHLAGEANDHVVFISLSVDRDVSECSAFDLHGRDPCSYLRTSQTGSTPFRPSIQIILVSRKEEGRRPLERERPKLSFAVLHDDQCQPT